MRTFTGSFARLRPLLVLGALSALAIAIASCGHDATAPQSGRVARGISFSPRFPEVLQVSGAGAVVPFTKVRIVLHHSNGTVALDTVVTFPADADELTLALTVALLADAPDSGEPMSLNLAYVNAAGDTVFRGGPITVLAVPSGAGQPAPVDVPVSYTGPGANATGVRITPRTLSVVAGDAFTFTATAVDAGGATIANTPVIWTSLDPTIATLTTAAAGTGTAKQLRGTARIVAQLLTGANDNVLLTVLPKAGTIAAASGSGQNGPGGLLLPLPVVARVTATDGLPMAGVSVAFSAGNAGSVGSATATTDANGLAQTTWTLGPALGAQSMTATATGLTGSPVTFAATATSGPATKLAVTTQPVNGIVGGTLTAIVITAQDAAGNTARAFTGPVTLALGANPGGATLRGATAVNAVQGVATFSSLTLDRAGTGYTLVASAAALTGVTTSPFNIVVPPPAALGLQSGGGQTGPAGATLPLPIVIQILDAAGANMALAGVPVTVSVTTGGGSVNPNTVLTNADGNASFPWTLGALVGTQSITASAAGLAPITVSATATPAVGQIMTWNGSVDSLWTNPANWTPNRLPGSSDTIYIGSRPFQPAIVTPVSVRSLAIGQCSYMRLQNTLTVAANLADSSSACLRAPAARANSIGTGLDTGTVVLTGNGTVMGWINANLAVTGGTHTVIGDVTVGGMMAVAGSAQVTFNGHNINVSGDFSTTGSGTIVMTNPSDQLVVNGNAVFAGGSEAGLLAAGTMWLYGDFTQAGSPSAFVASGTHLTTLSSGEAGHSVSFANPATSYFADVLLDQFVGLTLGSDVTITGTLSNTPGYTSNFASASGNLLTVAGLNVSDSDGETTIAFSNVRLRYVNGVIGATTFREATFADLGTSATFFEFARTSGGPYDFYFLSFSGILSVTGRYVVNTGTAFLNLVGVTPDSSTATSACDCGTWYTPGTGGIAWPSGFLVELERTPVPAVATEPATEFATPGQAAPARWQAPILNGPPRVQADRERNSRGSPLVAVSRPAWQPMPVHR